MSEPRREPPLYNAVIKTETNDPEFVVRELSDFAHIDLRGDSADEEFREAVIRVTGLELPVSANTRAEHDGKAIFWLAPDRWLLLVPQGTEKDMEDRLRSSLTGHYAVTDISSGQTVISLSGADAEVVIRKSSPYDLSRLNTDRCAQTVFAKTQVLLWRQTENEFQLVVRRSFADYLSQWLLDAYR